MWIDAHSAYWIEKRLNVKKVGHLYSSHKVGDSSQKNTPKNTPRGNTPRGPFHMKKNNRNADNLNNDLSTEGNDENTNFFSFHHHHHGNKADSKKRAQQDSIMDTCISEERVPEEGGMQECWATFSQVAPPNKRITTGNNNSVSHDDEKPSDDEKEEKKEKKEDETNLEDLTKFEDL